LRFAMTSPPSGCQRDFHPRAVEHARHTSKKGPAPALLLSVCDIKVQVFGKGRRTGKPERKKYAGAARVGYTRLQAAFFPALDQGQSCTLPHSPAFTGLFSMYWVTRPSWSLSRILRSK
jgi:hypothetical protein